MLILRALRPTSALKSCKIGIRCISSSNFTHASAKTVQERVNPYAKIHINCAYDLKIAPYDLLDCPDSNIIKATVNGEENSNLEVKITDKLVTITGDPNSSGGTECILEVPIKADLHIRNHGHTSLADLYSDVIEVEGTGNIDTKSLRSTNIKLCSSAGNIACRGITLAESVAAITSGNGSIFLDKLQGGSVSAITEAGKILVNASYSTRSSFHTAIGDLELKSIHKDCSVHSSGGKSFTMNGFYGTLNANVGSENVTLQLSEIVGCSSITTTGSTQTVQLNLADTVFETSSITVNATSLELDNTVDDKAYERDGSNTKLGSPDTGNTLHVVTTGAVVLRKMSWADSFSFAGKGQLEQ